jgi:hypothetical protein
MGAELLHAERPTDMTKANSHFSQLCKHTKRIEYLKDQIVLYLFLFCAVLKGVGKCHRRRRMSRKFKRKECVKCLMYISLTLLENTGKWMGLEEGRYG